MRRGPVPFRSRRFTTTIRALTRPLSRLRPFVRSFDAQDAGRFLEGIPSRDCFLVVADGVLVHEEYYGGASADTAVSTDSVGLLATVALVGVAEHQGLFDLDTPLVGYGVDAAGVFGAKHGAQVTARHILAQVHGGGEVPPGTVFRRDDSPLFLNLLGELIEKTSGTPLVTYARRELGEKLGAPTLFDPPRGASGEARPNTAGYLRATCREMAKVAQLFLNKGAWPTSYSAPSAGDEIAESSQTTLPSDAPSSSSPTSVVPPSTTTQLMSEAFAHAAMSVAYSGLNQAHGFATWIHGPLDPKAAACCRPVTGMKACGESAGKLNEPILGGIGAAGAKHARRGPDHSVVIALGNDGGAVIMLPSRNIAAVSLGRTIVGSERCPVSARDANGRAAVDGSAVAVRRDDFALLRILWDTVAPAVRRQTGEEADDEGLSDEASVKRIVKAAFEKTFAAAMGKAPGDTAGAMPQPSTVGKGAVGDARTLDAEVRRRSATQAEWYAKKELEMNMEQRRRQDDFDRSMRELKRTQRQYRAAYRDAQREIAAAAAEGKRAEAQEQSAATMAAATRAQGEQVAAAQMQQQELLERQQTALNQQFQQLAEAQAQYQAAAQQAQRARQQAVWDREQLETTTQQAQAAFVEANAQAQAAQESAAGNEAFEVGGAGEAVRRASAEGAEEVALRVAAQEIAKMEPARAEPVATETAKSFNDVGALDFDAMLSQSPGDKAAKVEREQSSSVDDVNEAAVDDGEQLESKPLSATAEAEADDFLSSLSPNQRAAMAAALAKHSQQVQQHDSQIAGTEGDARPAMPQLSGPWGGWIPAGWGASPQQSAPADSPYPVYPTTPQDAQRGQGPLLLPALGSGLWSWFVGGGKETGGAASNPIDATTGACVCACPGPSHGTSRESCFAVDLAERGEGATGAAACAELAETAAESCPSTGVVQVCPSTGFAKGGDGGTEGRVDVGVVSGAWTRIGNVECMKTATCSAGALGRSSSRSFLAEVYSCRAAAFASCRWAPSAACPRAAVVSVAASDGDPPAWKGVGSTGFPVGRLMNGRARVGWRGGFNRRRGGAPLARPFASPNRAGIGSGPGPFGRRVWNGLNDAPGDEGLGYRDVDVPRSRFSGWWRSTLVRGVTLAAAAVVAVALIVAARSRARTGTSAGDVAAKNRGGDGADGAEAGDAGADGSAFDWLNVAARANDALHAMRRSGDRVGEWFASLARVGGGGDGSKSGFATEGADDDTRAQTRATKEAPEAAAAREARAARVVAAKKARAAILAGSYERAPLLRENVVVDMRRWQDRVDSLPSRANGALDLGLPLVGR